MEAFIEKMPSKEGFLEFPNKTIRSQVVLDYAINAGYQGIVIYSCGNASNELIKLAQGQIEIIAPQSDTWLSQEEIAKKYRGYFDATSGHLPLFLMQRISNEYRAWFDDRGGLPSGNLVVPTGSGETIVCLQIAYPDRSFVAQYNVDRGSQYNDEAPLNDFVFQNFEVRGVSLDKDEVIAYGQLDEKLLLESFNDSEVIKEMGQRVSQQLIDAGVTTREAQLCGEHLVNDLHSCETIEEITFVGKAWNKIFTERGYTEKLDINLMERNRWVAGLMSDRLLSGSALEHDTGDAYVAHFISDARSDVTISLDDTGDFRQKTVLPFELYDYEYKKLPWSSGHFDQAMLITVLHHTDMIESMFDEVNRTVKIGGQIILFENTYIEGDEREKKLNAAFDWYFNAVIHESPLPLPFNHLSTAEWERFFKRKGFVIIEKKMLGKHKAIPVEHVIYVLQKI